MSSTNNSSNETQTQSACRKIGLTINANSLFPVYPEDPGVVIRKRDDLPFLVMGESVIFCLTFVNLDGTPLVFGSTDVFELSGDNDYQHGDDPLMLYADQSGVNLPGDWDQADPAQGRISIRVNCNTTGFQQKLAAAESITIHLEVRRSTAGNAERSVILSTDVVGKNTVILHEVPAEAAPDYYTAAETDALLNQTGEKITDLTDRVEELEQGGSSTASIGFPDWSNGTAIAEVCYANTVYTMAADGWLSVDDRFSLSDEVSTDTVYINGVAIAKYVMDGYKEGGNDYHTLLIPVQSGDTLKMEVTLGHSYSATLYPFRS